MAFLEGITTGIIANVITNSISTGFSRTEQIMKRIRWSLLNRNAKIRVSCACLLKLEIGGKYILIKSKLRKDNYGPIGGAIKYHDSARSFLVSIDYESEIHNEEELKKKINRDLRIYIPAKNLFKFVNWYVTGKDREENCLFREFKEELEEVGLKDLLSKYEIPDFSHIRKVSEGPHRVPGKSYFQFRILTIYELSCNYQDKQNLLNDIMNELDEGQNFIFVDSDEIIQGISSNGYNIGGHTTFLLGNNKSLPEDRPWTRKK